MNATEAARLCEEALAPLDRFEHQCHAAALELTRQWEVAGLPKPPGCRVARGWHKSVRGQHSWLVVGDPYAPDWVIDPTLWSYVERDPEVVVVPGDGSRERGWLPHGAGSIWQYGKPPNIAEGEQAVRLTPPKGGWSPLAKGFLDMLGDLDREGWNVLAHAPVEGWPAKDIIGAMYEHRSLSALVPVDIVGMVTDHNPHGYYWHEDE